MPETLLIKDYASQPEAWAEAFAGFDLEVRHWSEVFGCVPYSRHPRSLLSGGGDGEGHGGGHGGGHGDGDSDSHSDGDFNPTLAAQIDYALVWAPRPGQLARLPNLKLIFSLGAGLDHLEGDGILPPAVPVIRMVEAQLTAGMTEYVLYHALRFHRDMPAYDAQQRRGEWRMLAQIPAGERRVGILGLGVLGAAAARALVSLGFDVAGWSRARKSITGVASFAGDGELPALLARSDILVCLLPLTAATASILCAANFAHLPPGAFVINAGRGGHCVEADLLAALDSGRIAGAALDVFSVEPLPADSPLWTHPRVAITPHAASKTLPASSARHVIANIRRHRNGQAAGPVANLARGY